MSSPARWFPGGGEMGERVRAFDWSRTPIGAIDAWPQSLRTAVCIMLDSRYPMFVWWGEQLINIYNDSYIDVLGQRHPAALGQPAQTIWGEIWDAIGPLVRTVIDENKATFNSELELLMERNGYPEETFFTFSYSPLLAPETGTRGLFCACTEDTERVIGERRLRLLHALGGYSRTVHSVAEALDVVASTLAAHPRDVAFAMVYQVRQDELVLTRSVGLDAATPLGPARAALTAAAPQRPAAAGGGIAAAELRAVFADGQTRTLDAADVGLAMPGGAWTEGARSASVLPLTRGGAERIGVLVAGACPRRPFNDDYRQFFDLMANAISSLITNADAYENERRRADALAELDRAKTLFFSNVSHEFRTPLTLMMAPIEDLLHGAHDPAVSEPLRIAHRNGLRMLKLVNTLLDFSRLEAGRINARYRPVNLAAVTTDLASMFRSAVETAGLRFRVDCEPLDEPVYVDRDMWEKIVMNLLSNALKYTLHGEIALTLRRGAGHEFELTVSDTGIGIPENELPRVFERFHRVAEAGGRTQEGTGIGLALVRELCALHGGEVTAQSSVGAGSAFTVRLPLGSAHLPAEHIDEREVAETAVAGVEPYIQEALRWLPDAAADGRAGPSGGAAERRAGDAGGRAADADGDGAASAAGRDLLLVADDNADIRHYLRRLLGTRYQVLLCADGRRAAELAEARLPALVLSDVMMPGLDGFQLLARLRSNPSTRALPVVLLSARAGEEARAEGLEAGADDYIVKPFHARELLARIGAQIQLAGERRGAEQRITRLLENSTSGFLSLDADARYRYINAAAERLLGHPRQQLLGRTPLEVFPESVESEALAILQRVMRTRKAEDIETFFEPWNRWFRARFDPAEDGGVTVQFDDITLAQQALQTMRDTDRRKDEFLATLAHELRNPLAPIRNALQLLLRDQVAEPQTLYRMMERQTDQLTRLVDDLMEVSRINRGMVELKPERIEVAPAARSACESVQPSIDERQQTLEVALPDEPLGVDADPVRLAQAIANLLGNASKYTPDGGRIRLSVDAAPEEIGIVVEDNGIGIPADQIDSVFEPFLQARNGSVRDSGGLGLGLTVVRQLIERQHGRVEAHSDGPGRGSTFRLVLPRRPAPRRQRPPDGPPRVDALDARSVLVVDDNVDAANSLAMLLRLHGCEARVCYDGESAVAGAAAHDPDVVILDIGLPDIDGHEVARRIRAQQGGAARTLIALTGWGQPGDLAESAAAGFDHHLVKPALWSDIAAVLNAHAVRDSR